MSYIETFVTVEGSLNLETMKYSSSTTDSTLPLHPPSFMIWTSFPIILWL